MAQRKIQSEQVDLGTALEGAITGPASSVDNTIPRFDGTTGKLVQGSGITVSDTDMIVIPTGGMLTTQNGDVEITSDTVFAAQGTFMNADVDALSVVGVPVATTTGTQTLTNKRINPRSMTGVSSSNIAPNVSLYDQHNQTGLLQNLTMDAPTGTPVDGQKFLLRLKDNGTARTITWNAIYRAIGVTLPTTTTAGKTLYIGMTYNSADTKWDVLAVSQEL